MMNEVCSELDLEGITWTELADCAAARAVVNLRTRLPCRVLRYTPRRRVLYVPGRPALIVKQFFHRGALDHAQNFWRGAPALREGRALAGAERRGLAVPKALALGWRRQGSTRQSLLVTEFIDDAVSLEHLLGGDYSPQIKRRIVRQVARSIRAMHDKGFYQRDLHLGNLLYRDDERDGKVFFLDLQRVEIDPLRAMAKRWRDLAALHGGWVNASGSDRLRFLKAYLSVPPLMRVDQRRLARRLEKLGWGHRLTVWRSRQKRCLADNREFSRFKNGEFSGSIRRGKRLEEIPSVLADPARLLAIAVIVKDSRTTTVGRVMLAGQEVFVKRYNFQGAAYALKDVLRVSRAKRVWCAGNNCFMRGIGVALPIAYLERRKWRVLRESYLITSAVAGKELAEILSSGRGDWHAKRELIRTLASMLRRMHDRGVAHRDLKAENIIVQQSNEWHEGFKIIDFDGFACKSASWRVRAKNSARLLRAVGAVQPISRADRLRFAKTYFGQRDSAAQQRKFFRRIVKWSPISRKHS
jgi:tRNA A-37 threonylcarbamoyl transferase component Bud32